MPLFGWLMLRGRILTNDNLSLSNIQYNVDMCSLCDQEETPLHLILKCSYAKQVLKMMCRAP